MQCRLVGLTDANLAHKLRWVPMARDRPAVAELDTGRRRCPSSSKRPSYLGRCCVHGLGVLLSVLALVWTVRCSGERPPGRPAAGGPTQGRPGDTLWFWATSFDTDGGDLSYLFDWGDGSSHEWSAELVAGDTFFRPHIYLDSGCYTVRVRARDRSRLESDWSSPLAVTVVMTGPYVTAAPQGPSSAYVDTVCWFSVVPGHVCGESVSVQFDWGDTLGAWSGFGSAGRVASDSHTYRQTRTFAVRARARDKSGSMSLWSEPLSVSVSGWPLEPPRNLALRATSGTNVRLRWTAGHNPGSVWYRVWFRPIGGVFGLADSTQKTSSYHDPIGRTGFYTVSSVFGSEERFAVETLSTVPVLTPTTLLYELNAGGESGYGWDTITGAGGTFSMADTTNARAVDFYFTDFAPDWTGPRFYFATPHLGPDDPGGVPAGSWRRTGLLTLFGSVQQPLPEYDSLLYRDTVDATVMESYIAMFTRDGYYALVKNLGPDPERGTIRCVSWFQRVKGLRLIQHDDSGVLCPEPEGSTRSRGRNRCEAPGPR